MIGKIVYLLLRSLGFGAGTWPGEVAIRINPHIFSSFASQFRKGIILVAGTNGKTTTALMIKTLLEASGQQVVHNASGANLLNGIVSACIQSANWSGKIDGDYGVFEVDENTLPGVISNFQFPISNEKQKIIIVLLNLFRDQLDRYGEVDVIAEKWEKALLGTKATIIANADDPLITALASRPGLEATFFGLDKSQATATVMEHATDSTFCRRCGSSLKYGAVFFSHLGIWKCPKCGFKRPNPDVSDATSPLPGLYNLYNTLATVSVAKVFGIRVDLTGLHPAFGRQEKIGNVRIFLSKNPTGFNQSLQTVIEMGAKHLLLVLNDRIPDGRDVSWIWDVDFEIIPKNISVAVSGERAYDLALRLKYAGIKAKIYENLENALDTKETLYVLPTYSAMLEIRKFLLGTKIPLTIL